MADGKERAPGRAPADERAARVLAAPPQAPTPPTAGRDTPVRVGRRVALHAAAFLAASVAGLTLLLRDPPTQPPAARRMPAWRSPAAEGECARAPGSDACDTGEGDRPLQLPTGDATAIACDDARQVVAQARAMLAAPVSPIDPVRFAAATADWLDPHGLWSVAGDAPAGALVRASGAALLAEIQADVGSGPCRAAEAVGRELAAWSGRLRADIDGAYRAALAAPAPAAGGDGIPVEVWSLVGTSPFEDGQPTRPARELARSLGRDLGTIARTYGDPLATFVSAARARAAPELDAAAWSKVVVAAALRAYVPQLDAHGAWAPLDEEISIYDLALEVEPPARLWTEMTRTALGVRIDAGAMAPLADGDVVLRAHEVPLGCVSVEQAEQLSMLADRGATTRVTVLRRGQAAPLELTVAAPSSAPAPADADELPLDLVRYGDGQVAVLALPDVPDDLGARVSAALDRARAAGDLRGVLLDVRGNGGGSTDGAIATIGIFLPGASLFPMRRRDGGVEVERAPDVPVEARWVGPLAVLADGDSASAAEMIAGAMVAYRRGPLLGERTYGKGCAQEYLDDEAHAGVLRLTTLLFALPDGSPVQKVGVAPTVRLTMPAATEKEALTEHALGPWRGPDVRDQARIHDVAWPAHGGRLGPCHDEAPCRALRALGAVPAAAR